MGRRDVTSHHAAHRISVRLRFILGHGLAVPVVLDVAVADGAPFAVAVCESLGVTERHGLACAVRNTHHASVGHGFAVPIVLDVAVTDNTTVSERPPPSPVCVGACDGDTVS